jgi:hypothetical protein
MGRKRSRSSGNRPIGHGAEGKKIRARGETRLLPERRNGFALA